MNKIATIQYDKSFMELNNKIVQNNNIIIRRCYDIEPFIKGPIFINCKNVFFEKCDKKIVYNWLNLYRFPNVNSIYLLESHPCDLSAFCRFYNTDTKIYLTESYSRYKNKWARGNENVIILNCDQMVPLINTYIDEDIIITNRE